jgi:predicted small metal-binding protein
MAGKYNFAAKNAGKQCNFEVSAETREEVMAKAKEHASMCNICKDINEQQLSAAIKETPSTAQPQQ